MKFEPESISRLRNFTRSCDKTSYRLPNRGPASSGNLVSYAIRDRKEHIGILQHWKYFHINQTVSNEQIFCLDNVTPSTSPICDMQDEIWNISYMSEIVET